MEKRTQEKKTKEETRKQRRENGKDSDSDSSSSSSSSSSGISLSVDTSAASQEDQPTLDTPISPSKSSELGESKRKSSDPALAALGPLSRAQQDVTAKKDFFYLTALAVKLKHDLREDVVIVRTDELFAKAVMEEVPFYTFAEWIHLELTKAYLDSSRKNRLATVTGDNSQLRAQRKNVMTSLHLRHEQKDKRERGEL